MIKKPAHRTAILVSVFLLPALIGLFAIDIDSVSADRTLSETGGTATISKDAPGAESDASFAVSTPVGSILKMVSALIVVLCAVYLGLYLLKRLMNARQGGRGGSQLLEVIQTTYVGPKKSLSLVRVADRAVLVGVTEQNISVLTELDADETAVILANENSTEQTDSFGSLIRAAAGKLRQFGVKHSTVTQEG